MPNTQFLVALGICISLSSTFAAAETETVAPVATDSATASPDSTLLNNNTQHTTDTSSTETAPNAPASNDNNSETSNSAAVNDTTESKPTLIQRSVNTLGEIGSRSIEQVTALGSKIAVNANASQPDSVKDPFEHFNRKVFSFNMKLDKYILLPVARTYKKVIPTPVQHGVTNFFVNLGMPWTAVNNLLQGHPGTSIESLSRFVINTATTLGFYDTATYLGIERSDEDFGLTLGKWGIGSGPYVMLPFLGPSTVRDTFSRVVDQVGEPLNYIDNTWEYVGATGIKYVDIRARLIGFESFVQGDQYTLLRDVYLQKRQFENGTPSSPTPNSSSNDGFDNDDFGDDDSSKTQSSNTPTTPIEQTQHNNSTASSVMPSTDAPTSAFSVGASAVSATPPAQF